MEKAILNGDGFTLIELIMIIVVLGILATVAIPRFSNMSESSKVAATRQELQTLRAAIVGDPSVVAGGSLIDRGFEGDVGFAPSQLVDLVAKPDSISIYDKLTRLGWNGPYMDSSGANYLTDAWGTTYAYNSATRSIMSVGGADTMNISF